MNQFYVYVWLDPRKPFASRYDDVSFNFEPIYVGKGKGKRALQFIRSNNPFVSAKVNKIFKEKGLFPIVEYAGKRLSESDAFSLETKLIKTIGRYNLNNGPLCNLTDGGEGFAGLKRTEEHCAKISIANKGKAGSNLGKTFSEDHKRKIAESNKGKKRSIETRRKVSEALAKRLRTPLSDEIKKKISDGNKRAFDEGRKIYMYPSLSKEARDKISKSKKGQIISKEQRLKISNSLKGHQGNKGSFVKGQCPWNAGKEMRDETKRKLSLAMKGRKLSEERRKAMSETSKIMWEKRRVNHS